MSKDCPRCHNALSVTTLRGVNNVIGVDSCSNCGGIWFDKGELSKVDKIVEPVAIEFRHLPSPQKQMEPMHCPKCSPKFLMQKALHPRDEKVILDYCPNCNGIWLDHGELEAIQQETWIKTVGKVYNWLVGKEL
jgi:uncharacterized protein